MAQPLDQSIPAPAGTGAPQHDPPLGVGGLLENLSIGAGEGLRNQLIGLTQMIAHPIQTASAIVETGKAAWQFGQKPTKEALPIIADAVRTKWRESTAGPLAIGRVLGENISPRTLFGGRINPMREMTAYHGSPHDFDKFELSARTIWTGEGAQAYGHGLYFAEDPKIAGHYRDTLAEPKRPITIRVAGRTVGEHNGWDYSPTTNDNFDNLRSTYLESLLVDEAGLVAAADTGKLKEYALERADELVQRMRDEWPDSLQAAQKLRDEVARRGIQATFTKPKARLYTVDIPDSASASMLDWDAPMRSQPEGVRKFIAARSEFRVREIGKGADGTALADLEVKLPGQEWAGAGVYPADKARELAASGVGAVDTLPLKGEAVYRMLEKHLGSDRAASEALRDAGVPGLKFFDSTSRTSTIMDQRFLDLVDHFKGDVEAAADRAVASYYDTPKAKAAYRAQLIQQYNSRTRNLVVFDDNLVKILKKE